MAVTIQEIEGAIDVLKLPDIDSGYIRYHVTQVEDQVVCTPADPEQAAFKVGALAAGLKVLGFKVVCLQRDSLGAYNPHVIVTDWSVR